LKWKIFSSPAYLLISNFSKGIKIRDKNNVKSYFVDWIYTFNRFVDLRNFHFPERKNISHHSVERYLFRQRLQAVF